MNSKQDILTFLAKNKSFYCEKYSLSELGLFGSYARGEATVSSDVDILIRYKENAKDIFTKKQALKKVLAEAFNHSIDLANVKYLQPFVKEQILKEAIFV